MAHRHVLALALALLTVGTAATSALAQIVTFRGTCDGSGAVPLPGGRFASVDDEKNPRVRVYDVAGGKPSARISVPGVSDADVEPDLEAGAIAGTRSLWIGSHGRNSKGEVRPERRVLFSVPVDAIEGGSVGPVSVARVTTLLDDLRRWTRDGGPVLQGFIGPDDRPDEDLSPERHGLNIEAMAFDPRRGALLIGFRNPVPDGEALIAPVRNHEALLSGAAASADIGDQIRLGLGGRGLRDIAWSERLGEMLLLAGPKGDDGTFALYRWASGDPEPVPWRVALPEGFHPEAVVPLPGTDDVLILSDDGDHVSSRNEDDCKKDEFVEGGCTCKNIRNSRGEDLRTFRGVRLSVR